MRNTFWWFLFIQILSPEIDGWALWLYLAFPLLDASFLNTAWVTLRRVGDRKLLGLVLMIAAAAATLQPSLVLKAVLLLATAGYVAFLMERGNNAFDLPIVFQTGVCAIQFFGAVFLDTELLTPQDIGEKIWGAYALSGGGQFAEGLVLFTRVSGLCREPGFYSSIVSSAILLMVAYRPNFSRRRKALFYACAIASLLFAFSKISLLVGLIVGVATLARPLLRRVSGAAAFPAFMAGLTACTTLLYEATGMADDPLAAWQGGSIFFRTVGYYLIGKMNAYDLIFGLSTPYDQYAGKYPFLTLSEWWGFDKYLFDGTGIAYLIITGGLVSFLFAVGAAWALRINAMAIAVYAAFLLNANPFTLSAFVVVLYACVLKFKNVTHKQKRSSAHLITQAVRREQI